MNVPLMVLTIVFYMQEVYSYELRERHFFKFEFGVVSGDTTVHWTAIERREVRSQIDCSTMCLARPECTKYGYEISRRDCVIGINESPAIIHIELRLGCNNWLFYTSNSNLTSMEGDDESYNATGTFDWNKDGHQYTLVLSQLTWTEAKDYCISRNLGSHLATVTNEYELQFLTDKLDMSPVDTWVWIGGYGYQDDDHCHGQWNWVNGERWYWDDWAKERPSSYFDESCLSMYTSNDEYNEGQFYDRACDTISPFICEFEN